MGNVTISGQTFKGDCVVVRNGRITIDGKDVTPETKQIDIKIEGNVQTLDVDYCKRIEVTGDVETLASTSGDITVKGNVKDYIESTSGNVQIDGDVGGNVKTTSGDVRAKNITGKVKTTSGDIKT